MKYEILKNPSQTTFEEMKVLNLNCFPNEPYNTLIFEEMLKMHYWLITVDKKPVGFSYIKLVDGNVHVSRIGIVKAYRGIKLGQELFKEMAVFASSIGSSKMTLTVNTVNTPAISLYKKHHFLNVGEKYQFVINIQELIKNNKNQSVKAVNMSNAIESNTHQYDIQFVLYSGEIVGMCKLDTNFPGCSYFHVDNPEMYLEAALASLKTYLDPEHKILKIMLEEQALKTACLDLNYKLNYALMKMEKEML